MTTEETIRIIAGLTDEVRRINRRLDTPAPEPDPVVEEAPASETAASRLYSLDAVVDVVSSDDDIDWTTYNASSDVPSGATAVVLEGDIDDNALAGGPGYIKIREKDGKAEQILVGQLDDNGVQVFGRGLFPLAAGSKFDYYVSELSRGHANIRLVGYWK